MPLPEACRALRLDVDGGDVEVTDPAGRVVVYDRTGTAVDQRLPEIHNDEAGRVDQIDATQVGYDGSTRLRWERGVVVAR